MDSILIIKILAMCICTILLFCFKYFYIYKSVINNFDSIKENKEDIEKLLGKNLSDEEFKEFLDSIGGSDSLQCIGIIGKIILLLMVFLWILFFFFCIFNIQSIGLSKFGMGIFILFIMVYFTGTIINIVTLIKSVKNKMLLKQIHRYLHIGLFYILGILVLFTNSKVILLFALFGLFLILLSWITLKDVCMGNIYEDKILSTNLEEFNKKVKKRLKYKSLTINRINVNEMIPIVLIFLICITKLLIIS